MGASDSVVNVYAACRGRKDLFGFMFNDGSVNVYSFHQFGNRSTTLPVLHRASHCEENGDVAYQYDADDLEEV